MPSIRNLFSRNKVTPLCPACGQPLILTSDAGQSIIACPAADERIGKMPVGDHTWQAYGAWIAEHPLPRDRQGRAGSD
jgi:hypothetical protein